MAGSGPDNSSPPRRDGGDTPPDQEGLRPPYALLALIGLFATFMLVATFFFPQKDGPGETVDYGYLWKQAEQKNVDTIVFRGEQITGTWKAAPPHPKTPDKKLPLAFNLTMPPSMDSLPLVNHLYQNGATVDAKSQAPSFLQQLFWSTIPLLLMIAFFYFVIRRGSDPFSSGMMGNFIRSPAKRFKTSDQLTTFADVAAMDHAKRELQEIVDFLKAPEKFQRLGAQIPKGVLLMGPPGTGKTLLARATAGEAGVPFFSINGSEFIQMFVGVGASRVRDLFRNAKESSPCILFIDEIDAVGRMRGAGLGGGHDEREQTLNQILSEMDGFQQTEAVIVVAATNRPDVLDPALLRPGRFDRHVTVDRPNKTGREAILKVHCRKVPLSPEVNLKEVAAGSMGFSGAELKNLVNEAALFAAREAKDLVDPADFDAARDKILMGPKREEILSDYEREMTAYHEAGHALVAWLLPEVDPIHKVTIIPRGRSLGVTQFVPSEERYNVGERRLHSQLAMALGGRAAEKLQFDEYSAGAENDLKQATGIARKMVATWGMSELIGPVAFRHSDENPFLGKEIQEQRDFSEETARLIDEEVQHFLQKADLRARQLLQEHREKLTLLSQKLLTEESLSLAEITKLIGPPVPRSTCVMSIADQESVAALESADPATASKLES